MAAKGRRRTQWYGCEVTPITGITPGNGEATLLLSGSGAGAPESGATLIRLIGDISMTSTRSVVSGSVSTPQNAIVALGLMVQQVPSAGACQSLDLDSSTSLDDDRWLWVQTLTHRVTSSAEYYWNGTAEVIRYSHPDAGQHPVWHVDVRAKRRWEDPVRLCLHFCYIGEFTSIALRPRVRALFALP